MSRPKVEPLEGELYQISFSQANTFGECRRRWSYAKVDKIPQPSSWYLFWGTRTHTQIEEALLGEDKLPRSAPAQNAYNFVYQNGADCIEVEKEVTSKLEEGIRVVGYIDLFFEMNIEDVIDIESYSRTISSKVVVDWKTKASSPGEPSKDNWEQVQLYAYMLGEEADLVCICYPEYNKAFFQEVNEALGKEVYDRMVETGKTIVNDKHLTIKGDDQEYNKGSHCFFCPYEDRCNLAIEEAKKKVLNKDFVGIEEFSDAPFI